MKRHQTGKFKFNQISIKLKKKKQKSPFRCPIHPQKKDNVMQTFQEA
jgi:hypothetical protein